MLYSNSRVSMRLLALGNPSRTVRRVWKSSPVSATSKAIQFVASSRAYATIQKTHAVEATTKKTAKSAAAKKPVAKKPAAKKPAVKKPIAKKKPAAKEHAAKKPAAKKPVKKKKSVKKPAPKRRVLTDKQKEIRAKRAKLQQLRNIKEAALLDTKPKALLTSAWACYLAEYRERHPSTDPIGPGTLIETTKAASQAWKALSAAEKETYFQRAKENAAANKVMYKEWVSSYSAYEILQANTARATLRRKERAKTTGTKHIAKYRLIVDPRQPKKAAGGYSIFCQTKWATGAYNGMRVTEAAKAISAEYKKLSEAEKMDLYGRAEAEHNRYKKEVADISLSHLKSKQ